MKGLRRNRHVEIGFCCCELRDRGKAARRLCTIVRHELIPPPGVHSFFLQCAVAELFDGNFGIMSVEALIRSGWRVAAVLAKIV